MTYSPFYEDVSGRASRRQDIRARLEQAIEDAIAALDYLDGDTDLEDNADREFDAAEHEAAFQPITLNREVHP